MARLGVSIDFGDERNQAALFKEAHRRGLLRHYIGGDDADEAAPVGRRAPKAGYLPDGRPDRDHPVTRRLDQGLAEARELPPGKLRDAREAELLAEAVPARHWELSTRLLAPGWVTSGFSEAHRAMYTWYRNLDESRPTPLVVCVNRGGGKALDLDTPIPTAYKPDPTTGHAWTTMRHLRVGDWILDESGMPTQVRAKSPARQRPTWRFHFDGAAPIDASADHLWTVIPATFVRHLDRAGANPAQRGWARYGVTLTTVQLIRYAHRTGEQWYVPAPEGDRLLRIRAIKENRQWWTRPTACITVDSRSGLFLAGEGMVPTHNSATVQLICALVAMEHLRGYAIYVGEVQNGVKDKVSDIGSLLSQPIVGRAFPAVAAVYTAETGQRRDWRRDRIRTQSGFVCDALGMDQALRGARVMEDRPGLILLDDLESRGDTEAITAKKIDTLTATILPAGANNAGTIFVQNLVHANSMMAQLMDGRADFLADRITVGPIPQIEDLRYEDRGRGVTPRFRITAGRPTWEGKGLVESEQELNEIGPAAFLSEKQHDTSARETDKFPRSAWGEPHQGNPVARLRLARGWDLAATEGGGDYTVGVLMGLDLDNLLDVWILDVVRGQWGDAKVEATIRETSIRDRALFGSVPVVIEAQIGASGKVWNNRWKRLVLPEFMVKLVPPQGSKVWRADGYASRQQDGRCHLVAGPWNGDFITEHAQFPDFCDHDDQVDAAALAFNYLVGRARRRAPRASSAARRRRLG